MSLAMLELNDTPVALATDPTIQVARAADLAALAQATGRGPEEIARRWGEGHRAYVATHNGTPAAFGWVATRTATMGELGVTLQLEGNERYLWNFVTLPAFRGNGIYPRLLQEIIAAESSLGVDRFWIASAPENHASGTGIRKAGFTHVADLSFDAAGKAAVRPRQPGIGARVSALLGVPETDAELTRCWKCVRAGRGTMYCAEGSCECDYQRPTVECADHASSDRSERGPSAYGVTGSASSNGAGIR